MQEKWNSPMRLQIRTGGGCFLSKPNHAPQPQPERPKFPRIGTPGFVRAFGTAVRARIRERHYLFRLTVAVIALALVPYTVSLISILRYSYHEMVSTNEESYARAASAFAAQFSEQMNEYLLHATLISTESRVPSRTASLLQSETTLPYPVTYPKIIQVLQQYNSAGYNYGVYYPRADALFTTTNKYTASSYLRAMQLTDSGLDEFFSSEERTGLRFCAAYDEHDSGALYVGVPVTLGNSREPVIFFYIMDANSFNVSRIAFNAAQAQWTVLDANGALVYYTGKELITAAKLHALCAQSGGKAQFTAGDFYIFRQDDDVLPYTFVETLPLDAATAGLLHFYNTAWIFLLVNLALFVLLLILLLYISYRPVNVFVEKVVQGIHPSGEFETVSGAFEQIHHELSERNSAVLDFLLNNLLYGLPIPQNEAKRFGIPTESGYFRVFVLRRAHLDTTQRAEITRLLRDQRGITAFITDILGEAHTVLICLAEQPEVPHSLTRPLTEWLNVHFSDYELLAGDVQDSINRIRDSYLSCFPTPEANENAPEPEPDAPEDAPDPTEAQMQRVLALKAEVERYIRANFRDAMMSQTSVADHFKISVYSLSRLFRKHIGIGFTEFVTGVRLEEAQQLLLKTDLSIAAIAGAVGMPNSNYFSRLFKATYLVSPAQFRKNNCVPG